jgi:hypothetical protein
MRLRKHKSLFVNTILLRVQKEVSTESRISFRLFLIDRFHEAASITYANESTRSRVAAISAERSYFFYFNDARTIRESFQKRDRETNKRYACTRKRGNVNRSNLESYHHIFPFFCFAFVISRRIIAFSFCSAHIFTKCTNVEASIIPNLDIFTESIISILLLFSPYKIILICETIAAYLFSFDSMPRAHFHGNAQTENVTRPNLELYIGIVFILFLSSFPHEQDPYEIVTVCKM